MFVGAHVPNNNYHVREADWGDGILGEFILYTSETPNSERFMPVLVSIQKEVNSRSLRETILCCTLIYEIFRILPTVLIISIKGNSSIEFHVSENPSLSQCSCTFWANKCYLFFSDSLDSTNTSALIALCLFVSNPNKTLAFSYNSEMTRLTCE